MPSATTQAVIDALTGRTPERPPTDARSWTERLQDTLKASDQSQPLDAFRRQLADDLLHTQAKHQRELAADRGWQLVVSGALAGLPADHVEPAVAAVQAAVAAAKLHDQQQQDADAYAQRHGLRPESAATYKELHCAESRLARYETTATAKRLCERLARAAETIGHARAVLASEKLRKDANDAQWQATDDAIDADVRGARAALKSLGV